jgi:hypothetical protein
MLDDFPSEESLLRRRLRVQQLSMVAVAIVSAAVSAFAAWHLKPDSEIATSRASAVAGVTASDPGDSRSGRAEPQLTPISNVRSLQGDVRLQAEPQLQIVTEPAGARVTINGIGRGLTPITVRRLDAGEQQVRITLNGYHSVERTIFLAEGLYARSIEVALRRANNDRAAAEEQ